MMILSQYHIFELDTINIYSVATAILIIKQRINPITYRTLPYSFTYSTVTCLTHHHIQEPEAGVLDEPYSPKPAQYQEQYQTVFTLVNLKKRFVFQLILVPKGV